jgi:hypothetical protein
MNHYQVTEQQLDEMVKLAQGAERFADYAIALACFALGWTTHILFLRLFG